MKKSNILIVSFFLCLNIYGQNNPFKNIEMIQKNLEHQERQRYINEQLNYVDKQIQEFKIDNAKDFITNLNEEKYKFKKIKVIGDKKFKNEINKIALNYLKNNMGKTEIYNLMADLSNLYLTKGYTTTIVTIKSGNVNEGIIIYEIKKGFVRDIKIKNKEMTLRDKMKIKSAFPLKNGQLLNIYSIDQGIENMSVGGWSNSMEILPTEEYGYSDILIDQSHRFTGISLGVNNSGYKDKGQYKPSISLFQGNILSLNDRFSINSTERATKSRSKDRESNFDFGYSVPFGFWKFSYNYNYGDNHNTTISNIGSYKNESKVKKHKFKIQRILERGQFGKTTINSTFTLKDSENTMNGLKLDVSSKQYSNIKFGIDKSTRVLNGSGFIMLEYERGVPWFGSEGNPYHRNPGAFNLEYNKFNLNMDWQRDFLLFKESRFQYRLALGASYSPDRLLYSEQFSMGDEYTVRGFKESSVSGNKGIYINNTLTYIPTIENGYLSGIKPFIGLDGGVSKDKDLSKNDKIVGTAIGINFSYKNIYMGLTYSIPLKIATGMPKESNPVYFNFNYSL